MIDDNIKNQAENFFDCPSEQLRTVTYTSAMLFAQDVRDRALKEQRQQIADLIWIERGKCVSDNSAKALQDIIMGYAE